MSNKILIVGALVCLSVVAVAQSDQSKEKAPSEDKAATAPDAASEQANGKRMHKPMTITAEVSAQKATPSKTSAQDDWDPQSAKSAAPKVTTPQGVRVAPADVNGDGKAENAKNSGHATEQVTSVSSTNSAAANPRDIQTGQQSGKQQARAATGSKEKEVAPKQK